MHFSGPASHLQRDPGGNQLSQQRNSGGRVPLRAVHPEGSGSSGVWAAFSHSDKGTSGLQDSQNELPDVFPELSGVSGLPVSFSFQDIARFFSPANDVLEGMFLSVSSLGTMEGSGFPELFSRTAVVSSFRTATLMGPGDECGFTVIVSSGARRASAPEGSPLLE